MRRPLLTMGWLALASACGSSPDTATLELGLSEVPAEVASVTVVVRRAEEIVASATVAPTRRSVALGVPAEVPLEITVLARTSRPGPETIGRVPAYVGRLLRTIPLAADTTRVTVTLRPAGVLTVVVPPAADVPRQRVVIEPVDDDGVAIRVRLREVGFVQSYVMRAGRYRARFDLEAGADPPAFRIDAPQGLFVAREQESLYLLSVPEVPELDADAPLAIAIEAPELATVGDAVAVAVTATSTEGAAMIGEGALITWRVDAAPRAGSLVTASGDAAGLLTAVPSTLELFARAPTRAWIEVDTRLADGRTLRADTVLEVRSSTSARPAAALAVRVGDVDARRTGTPLLIELLDASGAYARGSTVTVDMSASDPWIDLGGPAILRITPARQGRALRRISAPSGPRGQSVDLRIRATADDGTRVGTATITLPPILLP